MHGQETTTRGGQKQGARLRLGRYVRVSRVGERDERLRSPEFQTKATDVKGAAIGAELVDYEPELDVSGSKRNRAILDSIVEAIERGELDGIIVYNLSRLSRLKPLERIELVERIEAAGGQIVSACESFDPSTPEGRFQRDLFFSIARLEWEKAAAGFAVAKESAIAAGRPIKARIPFGYRQAERGAELELVDEEAEVVRELYAMRAAGASYGECLAYFETATGKASYRTTVAGILNNRLYLGELRYGREVELVNVGGAPRIVEEHLFDAAQVVNRSRSDNGGRRHSGKAQSLLAGIATCASCGRGLIRTKTGSARTLSYKCPNDARHCEARAQIGAAELEAYIVERVLAWAGPVADELVEVEVAIGGDRIIAEHRLAEAEARMVEWAGNLELEDENPAAYRAGLEARQARVELRRGELEACGEATEIERARSTVRDVLAAEERDDHEGRRLLKIVLPSVVVRRTPRRGAPASERAELTFADAISEQALELVEELA